MYALRNCYGCLLALAIFIAPISTIAQASPHKDESTSLAHRVDWDNFDVRMFEDSDRVVTFTLSTSWIPGEKHEGMFRYIMNVIPKRLTLAQRKTADVDHDPPEEVKKLMTRVHECNITLNLYDVDGFVLRKIPVILIQGVDDEANVTSLGANDSAQMDMSEYKSFLGTTNKSGNWTVSWACLKEPLN
jgi:hypothetical protein